MFRFIEGISALGGSVRSRPKAGRNGGLIRPQRPDISPTRAMNTTIRSTYFRDPSSVFRWLCCQGPMWT